MPISAFSATTSGYYGTTPDHNPDNATSQVPTTQAAAATRGATGAAATVRSLEAAKQEVTDAKQYRATRKEAADRGIRMDDRAAHAAQVAAAARTQAANVNVVAKAACLAQAALAQR